ncbi:MAG: Flp pilus assembly protein CpaB [Actinomycetota bacterium]|nr:Flp pilus assembly protein CpaB [Actinomycetota bacterium]
MRQRGIVIIIAILMGLLAAFMVTRYTGQAKTAALARAKMVDVITAKDNAPRGLTLDALFSRQLVEVKKVPREYVPISALGAKSDMGAKVLAVDVDAGEQLTAAKFKPAKEAGLAFTVPADKVAVAIPIDDMKAAGNLVKVGDLVNVVGTAKGPEGADMTKTFLQKVSVLAVGSSLENPVGGSQTGLAAASAPSGTNGGRTVTLALSQADAEKLIFMQDQGRIWLTLLPSGKAAAVTTVGQTIDSVFK